MKNTKILIASDSFKGALSSTEACQAIADGIHSIDPSVMTDLMPIADGGEGTVETFLNIFGGEKVYLDVTGPDFHPTRAYYGRIDAHTAIIEMAQASGLPLVSGEPNPLYTTTIGTGQLIQHALNSGCKKIIIGIGGSATNDLGIGMASVFGYRFLDASGEAVDLTGKGLGELASIDTAYVDGRIFDIEIAIACDVENPLYGQNGAAFVYGRQKGASEEEIQQLDHNLRSASDIIQQDLYENIADLPGSGAAGGLGAGLHAFLGGELQSGMAIVSELYHLNERIKTYDYVITGEGQLDVQSSMGKVIGSLAKICSINNVKLIALCGSVETEEILLEEEIVIFNVNRQFKDLEHALSNTWYSLYHTARNLAKLLK